MAKRDYYDILGVSKSASADEIRASYRKLARKYHPDVTKNDPKLTEKFKEVQEAYDVLGDATKRQNYDQFGHAGVGAGPPPGGQGADPFEAYRRGRAGAGNGGRRSWSGGPGVSVEEFDFGGGDAGSIFEQIFGSRRSAPRSRAKAQPDRGQDVEYSVSLTFEQAARGTTLPIQIDRGGKVESIEVKIPPGVKDGSRVRIRGKGHPSAGENGDLFIITGIQPHPYYRREGLDIYVDVPVSLWEALFGAKVEVPTLDGMLTLSIPPGTGGGAKLRIKGKGVFRGEEHGDQFVIIKITMPKDLDESEKESLRKLAAKHPIDARANVPWR
jgi:DnaJ-class molecular chaperone